MKGITENPSWRTAPWVWGQHIAIASAYAACYELARSVSASQWLLTAGLRLACLLFLPIRYWPALAVGEGLPLIENAILCEPRFGWPWALSASVPMVVLWMAVMKPIRLRWSLFAPDGRVRTEVILVSALACSVITAVSTLMTVLTAMPMAKAGKWSEIPVGHYFWAFVLGAYLGALTLTPIVLALHDRLRDFRSRPVRLHHILQSPLLQETVCWVAPALVGLAWLATIVPNHEVRQIARFGLVWPVGSLAWRHGWHGAAVGGMGASVALAATAEGILDTSTLQIQVILALVFSGALLMSSRVAATRAVVQPGRF